MGYSGTTQLNRPGWVLKSSADVSLQKRKVKDDWLIDEFPDGPDNAEQCRCLDLQVERNSGCHQPDEQPYRDVRLPLVSIKPASLFALLGSDQAAADIGDANALLPLLADVILRIVGVDLKILETLIAVGIVAEGNNILASAIGHLMQIEASVPHLKLDAAHHVVIRV